MKYEMRRAVRRINDHIKPPETVPFQQVSFRASPQIQSPSNLVVHPSHVGSYNPPFKLASPLKNALPLWRIEII